MINNKNPYEISEEYVRFYDSADTWQIWKTPKGYEVWFKEILRNTFPDEVAAWLWLRETRKNGELDGGLREVLDTRDYIGMPKE